MKLIVGLGNPGGEYQDNRHNIGFRVVDEFARKFRISFDTHEKDSMTGRGRVAGQSILLAKPLTYMNLSGAAVRGLVNSYLESPEDLMVVYDDVDLPLGKLRLRADGTAGTHNGMKSIVASLGDDRFPRLRFGIRGDSQGERLRDFVLGDFTEEEEAVVAPAVTRSIDALVLFVRGELKRAMNQFNREPEETVAKEAEP
jgi:peptidyl-tRNA hydrolase